MTRGIDDIEYRLNNAISEGVLVVMLNVNTEKFKTKLYI